MITPERAEEIRKAILAADGWSQAGKQYTKEEEEEILRFWSSREENISFYDAVALMALGKHLETP
jgi:hypothetical protein